MAGQRIELPVSVRVGGEIIKNRVDKALEGLHKNPPDLESAKKLLTSVSEVIGAVLNARPGT